MNCSKTEAETAVVIQIVKVMKAVVARMKGFRMDAGWERKIRTIDQVRRIAPATVTGPPPENVPSLPHLLLHQHLASPILWPPFTY